MLKNPEQDICQEILIADEIIVASQRLLRLAIFALTFFSYLNKHVNRFRKQ